MNKEFEKMKNYELSTMNPQRLKEQLIEMIKDYKEIYNTEPSIVVMDKYYHYVLSTYFKLSVGSLQFTHIMGLEVIITEKEGVFNVY